MATITSIKTQKKTRGRLSIFVDGRFFCSLQATIVEQHGLQEGSEVAVEDLLGLQDADAYAQTLEAALRYLSHRPRSERELRARLRRGNFSQEDVEKTLATLRSRGYVDDESFARYWKETRDQFSPRGSRLVALELRQKGVDRDVVEGVIDEEHDPGRAYALAQKKMQQLQGLTYRDFRQRLGSFLARRGFDYDVINDVVKRLWRERSEPAEDEDT